MVSNHQKSRETDSEGVRQCVEDRERDEANLCSLSSETEMFRSSVRMQSEQATVEKAEG